MNIQIHHAWSFTQCGMVDFSIFQIHSSSITFMHTIAIPKEMEHF